MAEPERLDGRNGAIWRAYLLGRTQEAIAEEHGISQQRVSQVLAEVRASIPDDARRDAALVDLERLDALLSGVMPAALGGDVQAVRAALAVLERRARMLRLDLDEPLRVSFEKHLDDQGQLLADTVAAVLDALDLPHEQRVLALGVAQAALLGEDAPAAPSVPPVLGEPKVDPERAKREAEFRALMAEDGVDADGLLADDDEDEEDEGDV